jgi:hypothetical protein
MPSRARNKDIRPRTFPVHMENIPMKRPLDDAQPENIVARRLRVPLDLPLLARRHPAHAC